MQSEQVRKSPHCFFLSSILNKKQDNNVEQETGS